MWMSNCLVVVDRNNADRNSLTDIASALCDIGDVLDVDEPEHVIEVSVPSHEVATIRAMEGVSYVRCVFNYFCGTPPLQAA